jgi:hypothetical protein
MPNWTSNKLIVTGGKEEIKRFKKQASGKETEFLINNFIPMPEELKGTQSPPKVKGDPNWYDWRLKNWGVKWDVSDAYMEIDKADHLEYLFDTAWTTPLEALETISMQYPTLEFKILWRDEDDQWTTNEMIFCNGKVLEASKKNKKG